MASTRFFFDSLSSAASGLVMVLTHARVTSDYYRFGGLSAQQILDSGLRLDGDIGEISAILEEVPGAIRHDE